LPFTVKSEGQPLFIKQIIQPLKTSYKYAKLVKTDEIYGEISMIQTATGTSRAAQILAELEAKRRGPINALIEKQRVTIREELLEGIDEDHDEYLVKGNKIIEQLNTAEKELEKVRKNALDHINKAKQELQGSITQIDDCIETVNAEMERLVERADRLRKLNDHEEQDYARQLEREKMREQLQNRLERSKTTIREITEEMKTLRAKKEEFPKDIESRAVEAYKDYRITEDALAKLEKQSGKTPASLLAMIDQRIDEMRQAHELSIDSSREATIKLNQLLTKQAEFEISTTQQRDELYKAALAEIVARGLSEFFLTDETKE
jgi:chromosome segregation ATPase